MSLTLITVEPSDCGIELSESNSLDSILSISVINFSKDICLPPFFVTVENFIIRKEVLICEKEKSVAIENHTNVIEYTNHRII